MRLNTKKTISLLLALMMLLAVLTGCVGSGSTVTDIGQDNTGSTAPAPTDPTEPDATDPTDPEATDPTEPTPTEPQPTDPDATEPVDPTAPTEPEATDTPGETVTDPTTEPEVPDVPDVPEPTEAPDAPDEPDDVAHVHSYSAKVIPATCTAQGYTKHTCSCGDTYTDSSTAAKGHSYSTSTVQATCAAQGYTLHKCSRCGDSYKDNYTAAGEHDYVVTEYRKPLIHCEGQITYTCSGCGDSYNEYPWISDEDAAAFIREVEVACAKYINQFRVEQGDTEAIVLPGLTQVAQYRAVQLTTNYAHSLTDLEEAYAYYQYGEYHDMTKYGYDESYNYYSANAKEAIGRGNPGGITADEIAYNMISYLRDSAGHWSYLGSSDYPYLAVGCAYRGGNWYICTLQTRSNYG